MAERKSRTAAKSTRSRKKSTNVNRQLKSIIWFAVSILLFCIVFISGESFWNTIHNAMYGVFGFTVFYYPVLVLFLTVTYAFDKSDEPICRKIIELSFIVVISGIIVDIVVVAQKGVDFAAHLGQSFDSGLLLKSGGAFSCLLSHPMFLLFGKTGAIIILSLIAFVLLMIITGTTLVAFLKTLSKPVKKIENHAQETFSKAEKPTKNKKGNADVDIPIDDPEELRNSLTPEQKKVYDAYNDIKQETDIEGVLDAVEDKPDTEPTETTETTELKERKKTVHLSEDVIEKEIADAQKQADFSLSEDTGYKFPPISLLKAPQVDNSSVTSADLDSTAARLVDTLRSFGVETRIVDISRGPSVTRYELQPCTGVRVRRIADLADDIALNLASAGVRIEAPIPNKAAVGIEVPNKNGSIVGVREIIESPMFANSKSKLTIALGRDIGGNVVVADIAKMPHGLIAGATGSGKSVCINSIIMSILYKATPEEVKLLMIDPKVVELGIYNGIPHLLVPVVTDPRKAAGALGWAVNEMERRYKLFAENGVRDLAGYNKFAERDENSDKLPQIVIIIDELADLMMTAPKDVEDYVNRIAAKARAAGMHLIIATQRPSVDVVTGVIKANIPTRIAFMVSSQTDSRTILDMGGAEKLLGKGDMLFNPVGASKPNRIQGCFVSDEEVEAVVEFVKADHTNDYDELIMDEIERHAVSDKKQKISDNDDGSDEEDPMLSSAIDVVVELGQASTSLLQRKLKLGYARAARLVDIMEERGIVGPYEGSKPRQVLISREQWLEKKAGEE